MEIFLSLESGLEDGVSHPLVGIDPPIPLKPLIGTPLFKGLIWDAPKLRVVELRIWKSRDFFLKLQSTFMPIFNALWLFVQKWLQNFEKTL